MTPNQIANSWSAAFGPSVPAAFLCRGQLEDRWVRIHSLPKSKRYPDTDAERSEILRRHNTVAGAILGDSARCTLFAARFSPELDSQSVNATLPDVIGLAIVPELTFEQDDEDAVYIFAAEILWRRGKFDALILEAAEGSAGQILIANLELSTAYAPYDGGADLFLGSRDSAAWARETWSSWLSTRADGM